MGARLLTRVMIATILANAVAGSAVAAPKSSRSPAQDAKGEAKGEAKGDARIWAIAKADDTYVLRFGLPRATDPIFAVACQPGAQLIQFTVEVAAGKVKAGDGVALSLSSGKRRLELAASAFRSGTEGRVVVEAAVTLDGRVLDLFSEGDTLSVKMPGAGENFPLAGAKAKLTDFRRVCLGGR